MNWLKNIISHSLTTLVVGFLAGFMTNDYVNFRSSQRDLLRAEFNQSLETARAVDRQLALLSAVALGDKATKDPSVVKELGDNVRALYSVANTVIKRVPEVQRPFEDYSDAMVQLQRAAEKLTGPSDAKDFVEAVSEFYSTKEQFDKAVIDAQGKYSPFFIL